MKLYKILLEDSRSDAATAISRLDNGKVGTNRSNRTKVETANAQIEKEQVSKIAQEVGVSSAARKLILQRGSVDGTL